VCVCVCAREREERGREIDGDIMYVCMREGEHDRRDGVYVCERKKEIMHVCV